MASSGDSDEGGGDVIDMIPVELYNWSRAKLKSSLFWLLSKVYSSKVPRELQNPFYESSEGQLSLRPVVVNLLSSSELYCQACSNMFPDTHTQWQGHWSIIQVLSRKGIYISDVQDSVVTETVLVQTAPFRLRSHLALIDALMRAYTHEVASVEKVVKAVRSFTKFSASNELPDSPEEALLFWINKVCTVLRTEGLRRGGQEQIIEGEAGQKVRVLSKSTFCHQPVQVPLLEDLMRDIGNGCSVAAVIAYYRPHLLNITDLYLKADIGVADSLHNLRQVSRFCLAHFPWKRFHLTYEDLLYADEMMNANILAFLADLFFCFEGPGSHVIEDGDVGLAKPARKKVEVLALSPTGAKNSQNVASNVPVSLATKRSFQRQSLEETANNLGMGWSPVPDSSHQPLLPRRGRRSIPQEEVLSGSPPIVRRIGRRTLSLCSTQDRDNVHKSVLAWQDDQRVAHRSDERDNVRMGRGGLLANVSIDSVDQSFNGSKSLSLDLTDLDSQLATIDSSHPDHVEIEIVTSAHSGRTPPAQLATDHTRTYMTDHRLEPLMPATLKPTKEREAILSKAEERGERMPRRRKVPSPSSLHLSESRDLSVSVSSGATSTSSLVSALSTASSITAEDVAHTSLPARTAEDVAHTSLPARTAEDVAHTSLPARTAEDLAIIKNAELFTEMMPSDDSLIEKSPAHFVEHESRKIHQEYQTQELDPTSSHVISGVEANSGRSKSAVVSVGTFSTSTGDSHFDGAVLGESQAASTTSACEAHLGGADLSKSPGSTTSFAELKRLKEKLIYCLDKSSSPGRLIGSSPGTDLKSTDGTQQSSHGPTIQLPAPDGPEVSPNGIDLGLSELQMLRLKLEQKRKEIERKKHRQEIQQNKMRQRLGKAAFMRVVSKHLDGREDDELCELPETRIGEYLPNSTQAQLQARLGHQPQKGMAGGPFRGHPQAQPYVQVAIGLGGQSSITDWRSQSHLSKVAARELTKIGSAAQRPGNLDETQQHFLLGHSGGGTTNGSSLISSQVAGSRPFSRAGIQQTIDNVRNKWFGSDVVADQRMGKKEEGVGGGSPWVSGNNLEAGTSIRSTKGHIHPPPSQFVPHSATPPIPIATQEATSSPCPSSDEDYGSPLDKLNSSLSELQGEIMRLSLQHEQLTASTSPTSGQTCSGQISSPSAPSFRMHELSHQDQHTQDTAPSLHQQKKPFSVPDSVTSLYSPQMTPGLSLSHPSLPDSSDGVSLYDSESVLDRGYQPEDISITPNGGFFVSFGDKSTPKRPRPKFSEHHARTASPSADEAAAQIDGQEANISSTSNLTDEVAAQIDGQEANISSTSNLTDEVAATLAGQTVLATLTSPTVGFTIKDEAAIVRENVIEDEMQKKKIKLFEMQKKRKEEQERKRTEKEAEMTRKQEEKQSKEDEQERRKAEEKARREIIFQQYLQKKQEDEEAPAKPRPKKRDGSARKQRPKSMFVKSKASTSEPGSQGPDSGSSSREDLTDRSHGAGRSAPGVMSLMMHSLHSHLPPPSQIRKAVSSNALHGTSNGTQGATSQRRPPSPDLYRLKQRHRATSQDSGSETGSGSNPGSDYAGPKLFVKPSSRSNRHIIVNAISHCCLAGSVNTDLKNKVLEEMSKCDANHFVILFRDAGCQYRGLFVFYPETEEAFRVHGVGPKHIINDVCEKFYKYNSGGKSFSEITSTKHLSVSVDAVVLHSSIWKSVKAAVKR